MDFDFEMPTQKVGRRQEDETGGPAAKIIKTAELLAGVSSEGEDVVEGRAPSAPENGPATSYVEMAKELELSQKNAAKFFGDKRLVEKFGTSVTHYCRLGFDDFAQALKIYIKKDTSKGPMILPIFFGEIPTILQQIEKMLLDIEESVLAGTPLYNYPPGELIEPSNLSFWQHDDAWYSESMRFRMRFINARRDRYFFYLNSVNDNSEYQDKGYFGPKLQLSLADLEAFIQTMKSIVAKVNTAEI